MEEEVEEVLGGCWIRSRRRSRETLERPRAREPEKSILLSLDFALEAEEEGVETEEEEGDDGEGKDIFHQMNKRPNVLSGTW